MGNCIGSPVGNCIGFVKRKLRRRPTEVAETELEPQGELADVVESSSETSLRAPSPSPPNDDEGGSVLLISLLMSRCNWGDWEYVSDNFFNVPETLSNVTYCAAETIIYRGSSHYNTTIHRSRKRVSSYKYYRINRVSEISHRYAKKIIWNSLRSTIEIIRHDRF